MRMSIAAVALLVGFGVSAAKAQEFQHEASPLFENCGDASYETAKANGITVGISPSPPFTSLNPDTQKAEGLEVEIDEAAIKWAGIDKIKYEVMPFGQLIPALLSKRIDMVAALHITPDRKKVISFGGPAYWYGPGILVKTGNPLKLHSLADVKANPDVKIAILRGGVEENYLKAAGIPESQWVVLPDIVPLLAAVQGGRADVAFCVLTILAPTLEKMSGSGLEFAKDFVDPVVDGKPAIEYAAMGFRKEDDALRTAYNEGLAKLVASGELAAINRKYGLPDALTPTAETPTSDVLCKA